MYNITNNITAVSAEELGMVAADGSTAGKRRFCRVTTRQDITITCCRRTAGETNLLTVYASLLLKYKNRGTSVPGNIGTGEHRYRGI